uniref:Uncharacterized protein n=1 Tax=Anguilla anguilla TaxID=7936 RepID=A0A0E9XUS5_ANGAN
METTANQSTLSSLDPIQMPSLRSVEGQGNPTPCRASKICVSRQIDFL